MFNQSLGLLYGGINYGYFVYMHLHSILRQQWAKAPSQLTGSHLVRGRGLYIYIQREKDSATKEGMP